jgi:hypothetical protein
MGVMRDRIGDLEDRFFATVFLGSGLLFVAMMFAAAAIYAALAAGVAAAGRNVAQSGVWDAERRVAAELLDVFALRMGAVFAISTSTIALRTAMLPRWLAILGYGIALVLLVNAGGIAFVNLVFPLWTFVVSAFILLVPPDGPDAPNSSWRHLSRASPT